MVNYVYDAWGNHKVFDVNGTEITDTTHIGYLNPFRYRGYFYDVETGLYFLQSRYYDPEVGRFISQDSIEYAEPETINGLNLYAYCGNNPVMNVDPTGNKWWHWLVAGLIVVASAALAVVTCGTSLAVSSAFMGAAIGGGISLISQGINYAVNGVDFSWGQFALAVGIGAIAGAGIGAALGPGASAGFSMAFGSLALAGGGTVFVGSAIATIAALGIVFFAKDPFIKDLERGMSDYQKEMFQREIEDWKYGEGRGGADNLSKKILREIAEMIKAMFSNK